MSRDDQNHAGETLNCSFCGKSQHEVERLIAGPSVFICNECVGSSMGLLRDEQFNYSRPDVSSIPKPKDIHETLDDYVIGQDHAKRVLSVAVYNHYKRLAYMRENEHGEIAKSNILMVGPTGCGKTLLAQTLARVLDVPFAMADATTLTEAGYVGEDVETIVQKLVQAADYDPVKAESGIIYLDEIDKLAVRASSHSHGRDVSGEGVQQALLKIIEGTKVSVPAKGGRRHGHQETIEVDTSNILVICGGAFAGIEKVIKHRSEERSIGFAANVTSIDEDQKRSELLESMEADDLVGFGLIPEFVGRLPVVTTLRELDEDALLEVLTEPKNALVKQYHRMFEMEGVELKFEKKALQSIVRKAIDRKTGARGLRTLMEEVLLDTMFELPGMDDVEKVTITNKAVTEKKRPKFEYAQAEKMAAK